jgi:ribosomal-protein-alanine N-acetyltransferase
MLRIRAGRLEDVPGIIALERGIAEAPHWSEQEYAAMVVGGSGGALRRCLLVAETDSLKLIGLAAAKVIEAAGETVGELESVAVASEARRQGVGRGCAGVVQVRRCFEC